MIMIASDKSSSLTTMYSSPDLLPIIHFIGFYSITRQKSKHEHDAGSNGSTIAAAGASDCSSDVKAAVSTRDVIQDVEDNTEQLGEMCARHGKQDIIIIFTGTLFTQLYA